MRAKLTPGQATNVNNDYLSSGCMIVWAGFLW